MVCLRPALKIICYDLGWEWWRYLDKVLCHQLISSQPAQQTQVGELSWVGIIVFCDVLLSPPPPPQILVFGGLLRALVDLQKLKNKHKTQQNQNPHKLPPKKPKWSESLKPEYR